MTRLILKKIQRSIVSNPIREYLQIAKIERETPKNDKFQTL